MFRMVSVEQSSGRTSRGEGSRRLSFAFLVLTAATSMLSVSVSQIALGVALFFFLLSWARGRRPSSTGLEWPAGLLLGWALLMIPFSPDIPDSLYHTGRFYLLGALWMSASLADTDRKRRLILLSIVAAAVFNAVYSVLTETLLPGDFDRRIRLLQHSVSTGSWLMMCACLLISAMLAATRSGLGRILLFLAFLPPLAAVVLSRTRGAWLGLLAGILVCLGLRRRRVLPVLAVLLVATALMAPDGYKERAMSIFDFSFRTNNQRVIMWKAGVEMIRENPVTGIGDRNLVGDVPPVHVGRREVRMSHLHSNPVMVGVIWGIPGLVLWLWLCLKIPIVLFRRWRRRAETGAPDDRILEAAILGGLGVWVAVNVAGLFDWTYGDPELSLVFFLCVGTALSGPIASSGRVAA